MDSIDVTVRSGLPQRHVIDIPLKAPAKPMEKQDGLHFRLGRANHNDLVKVRTVPLVPVVPELPPNDAEWSDCTPDRLTIRKCGGWCSLARQDPVETGSSTIVIPLSSRIGRSGLAPLFGEAWKVSR